MPKIIELTVEIDVQRVSCPGVWLCQDGRVSLTIFALGTSYQTCLLPPVFPLMFKDVFYFRKRFQETCALNNICCLLNDETIYCELVQWCEDCSMTDCKVLAQYLGAMNDVLFLPNRCSNDGVDLLMRRSKDFPGILSPKIEITTKVRIDEILQQAEKMAGIKTIPCSCVPRQADCARQKPACHSAQYHRTKCPSGKESCLSRSRSRSRSRGSRSCCSLGPDDPCCPNPTRNTGRSPRRSKPRSCTRSPSRQYCVYNLRTSGNAWKTAASPVPSDMSDYDDDVRRSSTDTDYVEIRSPNKVQLESHYVGVDSMDRHHGKPRQKSYNITVRRNLVATCTRHNPLTSELLPLLNVIERANQNKALALSPDGLGSVVNFV